MDNYILNPLDGVQKTSLLCARARIIFASSDNRTEYVAKHVAYRGSALTVNTGGFTLSYLLNSPKTGYAVSLPGYESKYYPEDDGTHSVSDIEYAIYRKIQGCYHLVENHKGIHFGGWLDGKSGILYLDLSVVFTDYTKAVTAGKLWKQLAIYDIAKGETIYL